MNVIRAVSFSIMGFLFSMFAAMGFANADMFLMTITSGVVSTLSLFGAIYFMFVYQEKAE